MGQLTTTLAHELNQPLGAILSNAEAAEGISHESACLGGVARDSRRHPQGRRACQRYHSAHAGTAEGRELKLSNLAIGELIDEVVILVQNAALARDIAIEARLEPDLPLVRGDRVHLQQVLLNLLFNAMDSSNDCPKARRRIRVTARLSADSVVEVAVADYGLGIAPDAMAQLFEPFYTTKPEGMGMGLAISQTILEAHGGRIWAENNRDGGATFRLTLPVGGTESVRWSVTTRLITVYC